VLQNAIIIIIVLAVLIRHYAVDYDKGVRSSVFILLLAPLGLSLEIGEALPALTIHRFIVLLMAIEWLHNGKVPKRVFGIPFGGLILVITFFTGVSVLISSNVLVSIKRYMYFLFESVLFFFIIANSIRNKQTMISLMKTIALSLVVAAMLGIIERYTTFNPTVFLGAKHSTEFEHIEFSGAKDVTVTYLHRILFGLAMAVGSLYSLFLLDKSESRWQKISFRIAALLCIAALYFGMSRGPWLAFGGASVIMMLFGRKSLKKQFIVILALTVLVFIIRPGTLETLESYYSSTFQAESIKGASYEWRYMVLNMAYTKVTNANSIVNFLFGFGQGSHLFLVFPRIELATGQSTEFYSWDNEFAVILLEHGYVGIFLYAVFYFIIIKRTAIYCIRKKINWEWMVLPMTTVMALVIMKNGVKFFAPQLIFLEFANIAFASVILSDFSLWKEQVVSRPWINQKPEEITR